MNNRKQWELAQIEERKWHSGSFEEGDKAYAETYKKYFEYLNITPANLERKIIMEIGCADFPALRYCNNYSAGIIIEPLPSEFLRRVTKDLPIKIYESPAEEMDVILCDEVWIMNVYQHVMDPDALFAYAKKCAPVVRFFEPINCALDVCHLHSLSMDDFKRVFGDDISKHYVAPPDVKGFHAHECAYGVWRKEETTPAIPQQPIKKEAKDYYYTIVFHTPKGNTISEEIHILNCHNRQEQKIDFVGQGEIRVSTTAVMTHLHIGEETITFKTSDLWNVIKTLMWYNLERFYDVSKLFVNNEKTLMP